MADPYDLERFVRAQDPVIDQVLRELRQGRKTTHWMWFVFPQLRGLGRTEMAWRYGITGLPEARAYREHPVLGPRLLDCTRAVLAIRERSAREILGTPDDLKLRSSMTLFEAASVDPEFPAVIDALYGGIADLRTVAMLGRSEG